MIFCGREADPGSSAHKILPSGYLWPEQCLVLRIDSTRMGSPTERARAEPTCLTSGAVLSARCGTEELLLPWYRGEQLPPVLEMPKPRDGQVQSSGCSTTTRRPSIRRHTGFPRGSFSFFRCPMCVSELFYTTRRHQVLCASGGGRVGCDKQAAQDVQGGRLLCEKLYQPLRALNVEVVSEFGVALHKIKAEWQMRERARESGVLFQSGGPISS